MEIKKSMYEVDFVEEMECLPCEANPFFLACRVCKTFAHDGVCKHVLVVTHELMGQKEVDEQDTFCNLRWMAAGLYDKKKAARMAGPKRQRRALERQPQPRQALWSEEDEAENVMTEEERVLLGDQALADSTAWDWCA